MEPSRRCDRDGNPDPVADGDEDAVAILDRWQHFGGTWRVTERSDGQVTIALFRCDGGEEQQRIIVAAAPAVLAWLDGRIASTPP